MTKTKNNGGCAFPFVSHGAATNHQYCDDGMSLRDWFAGMAMMGMRSNSRDRPDLPSMTRNDRAVEAYRQADAMLEVRNL